MLNNSHTATLVPATTSMEDPKSKEFEFRHMIRSLESSEDKENNQITVLAVSSEKKKRMMKMNIQIPTLGEHQLNVFDDDDEDEGFRTPTSLDKKIPVMISPKCPPPPRKPKSISLSSSPPPPPNYKRKTPSSSPSSKTKLPCRCRCKIRISDEDIKALFPPTFLVDLGRKMKKARNN